MIMESSAQPSREMQWTDAQWRAIKNYGQHILVSAGAGAGKTMVLVKRLLERITDKTAPLDVDRLLVVTFTNAAAAEMRKRLAALLSAELGKNPQSSHIRRQLLLLHKAWISTVHSFCLEVIREYSHNIGLDPSFRILDEEESLLLQQDLLEELLEEYYATHELQGPFYRLAESRSSVRGDRPLEDLIIKLYHFAWSHPEPERWLEEKVAAFVGKKAGTIQHWLEIIQEDCRWELKKMLDLLQRALKICEQPGGPDPYQENIEEDLALLRKALDATSDPWEHLSCAVQEISFAALKQCRGDCYNAVLKDRAKELRERCKKDLARLREQFFSRSLEELEAELERIEPLLQVLVQIVHNFHKRYQDLKLERGMADFNDLEHYALQILRHPDSPAGRHLPSAAALSYRERFATVLVDEYQDINQLQEAIITLVARDKPGNMFMVGDVKQSIYRFRLAEPELFLKKMRLFNSNDQNNNGDTIFLTHNFRSRREIINGVNYLFRQIMDEKVGEVAYDDDAELRGAAVFPPPPENAGGKRYGVDVLLVTRAVPNQPAAADSCGADEYATDNPDETVNGISDAVVDGTPVLEEEEWEAAAQEGKAIARRIIEMRGEQNNEPLLIYDKKAGKYSPPAYRDIVILMRSNRNYAPAILEELQRSGIPAYAEVSTGYFAATEVEVMLSLLKIIDNPYQDIPLAAVLRSPLVGLCGEQLAKLRITAPNVPFYEALKIFIAAYDEGAADLQALREKLQSFTELFYRWQETARQESLGSLIWQIYTDSGYYDLVGGMPGGRQRQANLRALCDRARQYEATSFRGLSRFLSFVERLQKRGDDLGTARALGEQEDVVRLLTVHKSKGLEFPVVFVAGLARQFNMLDLRNDFLLHKELGFGPKYHDMELRLIYPTLPWLAVRRRLQLELLAEEMRILYVALTRSEQKLVLVAALRDIKAEVQKWEEQARQQSLLLPEFARMQARSFLEWLGPALLRHKQAGLLREMARQPELIKIFSEDLSDWKVEVFAAASLRGAQASAADTKAAATAELMAGLKALKPVSVSARWENEIARRLGWRYAYPAAIRSFAKLSVSALQRLQTAGLEGQDGDKPLWLAAELTTGSRRPRLLETVPPAAAQGIAYHLVMRLLELQKPLDKSGIICQMEGMAKRGQLTDEELKVVDPGLVSGFFQGPLGQRLLAAQQVWRELPFSMIMPASQVYADWQEDDEQVFIQGVIDCIFREADGLVLVDYKFSESGDAAFMQARYSRQIYYYTHAVAKIRGERVKETYLYIINQQKTVKMEIASGS